jgi:hypothetical protein
MLPSFKSIVTIVLLLFFSFIGRSGAGKNEINPEDATTDIWSFDDTLSNESASFYGKYEFVPGIEGNALKLDGFRTFVQTSVSDQEELAGGFTVEAWIAIASYPWSWSPVLDCTDDQIKRMGTYCSCISAK